MTQIKEVIRYLESIAPKSYAESYDNPGLIVGNEAEEITGVLVSLDCTEAVVEEAVAAGCNLVVSHHPIVFRGLKSLTGADYVERTVISALKNGVALYATHTNLDSVANGVSAKLAEMIGLAHGKILQPKSGLLSKLTYFVPTEYAERVREAVFKAGAGRIGEYAGCSFNLDGTGTFTPSEGAKPFSGKKGEPEAAAETRTEVMFPAHLRSRVLAALFEAHPYEETAYYLHDLANVNQFVGLGMIGTLPRAVPGQEFLALLKERLGLQVIRHTAVLSEKPVKRVAVCGGSGSFLLKSAISAGADAYVTADFKYHEFFDAEDKILIADVGHYESERFTIDLLATVISEKFSTFATRLTGVNTNPVHYYH